MFTVCLYFLILLQSRALVSSVQDTIFSLADSLVKRTNESSSVQNLYGPGISLAVVSTNDINTMAGKTLTTDNVTITLPESLRDVYSDKGISLLISVMDKPFPSTRTAPQLNMTGKAFLCRMVDSDGHRVKVEDSDPISLEFTGSSDIQESEINDTLVKINLRELGQATFVARFFIEDNLPLLLVIGRFDKAPTEKAYDFQAMLTYGKLTVKQKPRIPVNMDYISGILKVSVFKGEANFLYLKSSYEGLEANSTRRRLLSASSTPTVAMNSLAATYWDSNCACWTTSSDVQITDIRVNGNVRFTTNFLGAFSLSELIILPETIDFESLFLNFSEKLSDSPYVLALNCVILSLTVIVVAILRRIDLNDSQQWAYLPLIGNEETDKWHYAISVETSVRSQKHLNAVPCMTIIGQFDQISAVVLSDGMRENFKRGTTSNFILSSKTYLGPLMEIKIWLAEDEESRPVSPSVLHFCTEYCQSEETHFEAGHEVETHLPPKVSGCCCLTSNKTLDEPPYWKLGHITIKDLASKERYTFLCQDWLSKTHGDGQTIRHIPVLDPKLADSGTLFDLISKRNLCDQHLWLSVVTRPSYTVFSRVQRFLCAVSCLYLAMIANAMWYRDAQSEDQGVSPSSGITLGVVTITYRTFYVGLVSSIFIIIPTVFMTCMFRNRNPRLTSTCFKSSATSYEAHSPPKKHSASIYTLVDFINMHTSKLPGKSPPQYQESSKDQVRSKEDLEIAAVDVHLHADHVFSNAAVIDGNPYDFTGVIRPHRSTKELSSKLPPLYPFISGPTYPAGSRAYQFLDNVQMYDTWNSHLTSQRQKWESDLIGQKVQRRRCMLPWWTIFIGYSLVFVSIMVSAALTFFYSLQWGGVVSLEWMASLFFSTTTGTFFIEPIKIVLISLLLSCLLRASAQDQLSEMAPLEQDYLAVSPFELPESNLLRTLREPDCEEIYSQESVDLIKRRKQLKLQQRLFSVLRGISFQAAYVVLVGVICLHSNVSLTFLQNQTVRNQLSVSPGAHVNIANHQDLYQWLLETAAPNLLPKFWYNQQLMSVYQQRFTSDLQSYRLTPVSIVQKRVKGNCPVSTQVGCLFQDRALYCNQDYDDTIEDTAHYTQGWIPCDSNCSSLPYTYTPGAPWARHVQGVVAVYSPGGYQVVLVQEQRSAKDTIQRLKTIGWLDQLTRAVIVEFSLFNPSTRLFVQVKVLDETPSYGGSSLNIQVQSANLYPYTDVGDYLLLLVQLIFAAMLVARLCLLLYQVTCARLKTEGKTKLGLGSVVELIELGLSVVAVVAYGLRIDGTIALVEFINNNPNTFASLDTVLLFDNLYTCCCSSVLFVRILGLLGPLAVNSHLYIMRQTLMSSISLLLSLGITVIVIIAAFSFFFYIYNGGLNENTKSVMTTMTTLLVSLLGMSKSSDFTLGTVEVWQVAIQRIMFGLFSTVSTIMLLNFAISTLNISMETVKRAELRAQNRMKKVRFETWADTPSNSQTDQRDELDREMGSYVFDKLSNLFSSCSSKRSTVAPFEERRRETTLDDSDIQEKLESIISKIRQDEYPLQKPVQTRESMFAGKC